jgi:hypothetical protein
MGLKRGMVSFAVYICSHFYYGKEYRWEILGPALPLVPCLGFFHVQNSYPRFLPVGYLDTLSVFQVVVFMAIVPTPWSLLYEY